MTTILGLSGSLRRASFNSGLLRAAQDGAPAAVHHDEAHADAHGEDAHGAHHHDFAEATGVDFPVPADHVRWEPDAPLIEGMSRVRTALAALG